MVKIVQKDNEILREKAKEVPFADIGGKKITKILKNMSEALAKEDDGVAIAAPQIAVPLRMFVITGRIFSKEGEAPKPDLVFINPKITALSKTKIGLEEGCLSVRWFYGVVKRSDKATVEAYDENGKKFTRSGSGLIAQIFQHEMDHLDGVLFIDKTKKLQEIKPELKK